MGLAIVTTQWCVACATDQAFEQPPCPDGHGADCPEWLCLDCGSAVVLSGVVALNPAA